MSHIQRSRWRHAWLPIAALAGVVLSSLGSRLGTFDPTGQQVGANWPGEFLETLGLIAIELAVLYVILRPWSYSRNWGRALVAGLLVAPFAVFAFAVTFMHGSLIALMHVIWLGLVAGGLFVAALVSASAAASETSQAAA